MHRAYAVYVGDLIYSRYGEQCVVGVVRMLVLVGDGPPSVLVMVIDWPCYGQYD